MAGVWVSGPQGGDGLSARILMKMKLSCSDRDRDLARGDAVERHPCKGVGLVSVACFLEWILCRRAVG